MIQVGCSYKKYIARPSIQQGKALPWTKMNKRRCINQNHKNTRGNNVSKGVGVDRDEFNDHSVPRKVFDIATGGENEENSTCSSCCIPHAWPYGRSVYGGGIAGAEWAGARCFARRVLLL